MANYDFGGIPASDADRDRVRSMLQSALSQGRIGQDEFNRRQAALYSAQTYGQLGSLTSDLTGGGPASQAGSGFRAAASGFGGPVQGSGFGNQGGLGFQSGADFGHAGQPGPGNPIGQQPDTGSPVQNSLNQAASQQGFGAQNQFGAGQGFGPGPNFGPGPSFGPGPDFGNQGTGNQYGNQGFGNQYGNQGFGNQGFGNQYGYQDPNQPGYILGNMINNAKMQGLGRLVNSGLLGTYVDGPSRRGGRFFTVGRIIRMAITFIGIGIALYFALRHGHFETCTSGCDDGGD